MIESKMLDQQIVGNHDEKGTMSKKLREIKEDKSQKMSSVDEESLNAKEGAQVSNIRRDKQTKNVVGISVVSQDTKEVEKNQQAQTNDEQLSEEESSQRSSGSAGTSLTSDPISPSIVEQITEEKVTALRDEII